MNKVIGCISGLLHPSLITLMSVIILMNIFCSYPSTLPLIFSFPNVIILTIVFISAYIIILTNFGHIKNLPSIFNQVILVQIILWICFYFFHKDSVFITRIVYSVNAYLAILCLYQFKNGIIKFSYIYEKVILLMSICGVIGFILVFLQILKPISIYQNVDSRPGYFYGLTCTNAPYLNFIRYSGFFDEPGAMAGWGMYAIILNLFTNQNKKIETILISCLCFTFSIAYYIQLFIYISFFKIKKISVIIYLLGSLCLIIGAIYYSKDTDFDIYKITLERFESDGTGNIKGDNRSALADKAKKYFLNSPIIGNGPTTIQKIDYMGDNPYELLATDGIIGSIVIYLPLLILIYPFNKKILLGLLIIMVGYMQRPFHCHFIHFFMIYLLFISIYLYRKNNYEGKKSIDISYHNFL